MKIFERLKQTFYYNVSYPYPNRRLYGIEKARGGRICSFLESEKSKLFPGLDLQRIPHFETTSKCRYCANQKNQIKLNHKKGC